MVMVVNIWHEFRYWSSIRVHGDWSVEVPGRSADAGSGRKEVGEKRREKDRMRQMWWRWVYWLVSLIVNLGNQRSHGSSGTGLVMRDTKVPQRLHKKP